MELEDDVILAREGDREAFIRLIQRLEMNMYRVARAIVKRDEDCDSRDDPEGLPVCADGSGTCIFQVVAAAHLNQRMQSDP
ncbi:hypothetical protein [Paenibacillus sp. GYB004]|uniref:hypothetical protein n=1 Tax=Paenibacillus sp. GYB004 TaxID=2994393 RepID=UPI002F969626